MREIIVFAPGLNGQEFIKSLVMHGKNCINLRICNSGELARIALMRSGISIQEDFVDSDEETTLVAKAVEGNSYFDSPSYADIKELTAAIRRMRSLVSDADEAKAVEETLSKGIFSEKNAALISVYKKYNDLLTSQKLVDSVSLVRRAATVSNTIEADFITLDEFPLTPLDKALLNKISEGKFQQMGVCDLFGKADAGIQISSFKNCYGAPNEVESVIADIYSNKNLDECTVAVTDIATYGQLFFDYALLYDIPVTFGCGISIVNSNPAKLLSLYYKWMTRGFFGAAALNEMIGSPAFNRAKLHNMFPEPGENFKWKVFYEVLGALKLTNDKSSNDKKIEKLKKTVIDEKKKAVLPSLEIMASELSLPVEEFISKYSFVRDGTENNKDKLLMNLDMAASGVIYGELSTIHKAGIEQDTEGLILSILKNNVCAQRSEAGKLHVTSISGAISVVRKNMYITGLSATKYPGSPRENYLLLDADLNLFGKGAEFLTADGRILKKRENLLKLASLATALESDINVSYAGLNVSELKRDNASSLMFELFRQEHGENATAKDLEAIIKKVDYFAPAISVTRGIGDAYDKGYKIIKPAETSDVAFNFGWNLENEYSPTALDRFFSCPRSFLLSYILGIPEPEVDDPFEIISAAKSGSMAHSLMEELGNSNISNDEFQKLAAESFDSFILENPPLIEGNVEAEKEQFLQMMDTAYEMDPHREVVLKEEDVHCVHESGVKIHGLPDRVEKLDDGSYLIVDFKTGRKVSHIQDDIGTCLQVVIYAYLMEKKGFKISEGEYRYIRLGEVVTCKYDDEMKKLLLERLNEFRESILKGEFPLPKPEEGKDPCRYCKYGYICGKTTEESEV
ncbi:PD-(D/E)XK nuclease family protein [Butyrivibrio sp. LC3010]|uniref:PD-(D/E)XK nuclease family protein n=1 Tax=Butyrivibrio sp. LC3010 TaxID=1280680 RepID=UPI0004087FE7|nr:PD-(D/E)XK nuclease family protein [Butyrivibrio sp. LC3010]